MSLLDDYRQARRAQILVAARRMIVERGYEAVTIRELASECGVSVPTLYNQFGGNDALLAEAIEDQFRASQQTRAFERAEPGLERLLTVIDQSAQQLLDSATYSRRLLAAFTAIRSTTAIQQKVGEVFVEVLIAELSVMRSRRQLLPWVDLPRLAGQLVSANIGIAVQWSSGLLQSVELQPAMRYAMGLVLLGVLRGTGRDSVAHMIEAAQAGFASPARERNSETHS